MHTVKIEFKPSQASEIEEKLLTVAHEQGQPLNFSLMVLPKKAILTGYFDNKQESLEQLALLGLEKKAQHGYLKARDWQDSVKKHFKPFAYRNVAWAPEWITQKELKAFLKELRPLRSAKQSLDEKRGAAQNPDGSVSVIHDQGRSSSNKVSRQNLQDERKVIKLHMGMAFGTGNHPTTRLCLRRCVELVPQYKNPTVLDVGCGSGVLAITAKALGAKAPEGFDIDEHSIEVCKRNAKLNNQRTKFYVGDLYKDKLPTADIVFANLLANLITDNAKKLWGSVNKGGTLVLSGLLKEELDQIAALFPAEATHHKLGMWGALVIKKH